MQPQFMQFRARAIIAVLAATILLSACGSKPEAEDIRKQLVSGIQCNKFIIRDVKKTDGAEAPNKQYEVAYTFVAEIKGGKAGATDLLSKWDSLNNREQEVKLLDCDGVTGNYWLVQLNLETRQNLAKGPGPIPIPYALEFQGTGFMKKAESGWVFMANTQLPQVGKIIQSEPIKFERLAPPTPPTPPAPVAVSNAAAPTDNTPDAKIVAEATGGKFKATKGRYFDSTCNESLDYEAKVIDLNGDGQPEVFTSVDGTCLGGMAGVYMDLFIKDKSGRWKPQFGFSGMYTLLTTKSQGYPDIEVVGPGNCSPVWRWTGQQYAIYKKCP